ncbi:hypothetical protein NQZ68_027356 [Dissostichus eleginoides]|nr:hypothetical protein NQZ68_027356 [Dissostichus eleginoides]
MDVRTSFSQTSLLTAACLGPLLSPDQTQTHISHIPQPPKAPGAASQLGTELGRSLPPWLHFHHHNHPRPPLCWASYTPLNRKMAPSFNPTTVFVLHRLIPSLHDEIRRLCLTAGAHNEPQSPTMPHQSRAEQTSAEYRLMD